MSVCSTASSHGVSTTAGTRAGRTGNISSPGLIDSSSEALSFDNVDVAIDRQFREALDPATRRRPANLHPLRTRVAAEPEHLARIVGRQVAAAAGLQPGTLHAAGRP